MTPSRMLAVTVRSCPAAVRAASSARRRPRHSRVRAASRPSTTSTPAARRAGWTRANSSERAGTTSASLGTAANGGAGAPGEIVPKIYPSGGAVEELADLGGEDAGGERLGEQLDPLGELPLPGDRLLRVAGDVEDVHLRPERPRQLHQLVPAHARHHHVREQEGDGPGVLPQPAERLDPVVGLEP